MRALVSIGGFDLPEPSTYAGTASTAVDSGRNVEGYWVGSVIRDSMAKVEMTWNFISVQDWANICAKFDGSRGGSFVNSVTFFCTDTGQWETRSMYVNDRKANIFLRNKDGSIRGYTGASLNLIET